MSFPLASESPPTLTPYQLSFNGYTFGSGQPLRVKKIDGLDLPTVRTGDSGRPREPGLFAGLDVLGGRLDRKPGHAISGMADHAASSSRERAPEAAAATERASSSPAVNTSRNASSSHEPGNRSPHSTTSTPRAAYSSSPSPSTSPVESR